MTDDQIIDLFWNRNEDAIAATDAAYGRKPRGLSGRILQNQEDAEEIVNDTYMKTWDSIPKARPQYFYAYIAAICRHLSLNLLNWNQAAKRKAEIVSITEELEQCICSSFCLFASYKAISLSQILLHTVITKASARPHMTTSPRVISPNAVKNASTAFNQITSNISISFTAFDNTVVIPSQKSPAVCPIRSEHQKECKPHSS